MDYVRLGKTGMKVSRICLGCMTYGTSKWRNWVLDEDESRPFFKRALELGINFFDTANMYSRGASEEVTGRALRDFANRDDIVVATKVFHAMRDTPNGRGLSRKHIMESIDASLTRLGMDYVDLYQIHRWDYQTPIEETLEALHDVVKSGKARYIGASSMWTWQFVKANYIADLNGWTRFISMQSHYNLIAREDERELIPYCIDEGIGLIPWSPLARGFLAGKRTKDQDDDTTRSKSDDFKHRLYFMNGDFAILDRVEALAQARGVSPAQIALAWMLSKPHIQSPIIGASKMPHLEQAVAALDITLSEDEIASLEELYVPHAVKDHV